MTADRDIVLNALTEEARANGYKPVGKVYFYKERPEVICVLNLQKSAWGPQHYLNAGVTFKRLATTNRPKFIGLHILWRADSLASEEHKSPFSQALDLDNPMDDDKRRQTIKDEVNRHAFVHLAACMDEASTLALAKRINAAVKRVAVESEESRNVISN